MTLAYRIGMKKGDRVQMKGLPKGHAEQDRGTVIRVDGDRARVLWEICEETYWERVDDLEVTT